MFSYDRLVEGAQFPDRLTAVFQTVGTTDFEHVMWRLNQARELLRHYEGTSDARKALKRDSDLVRSSLIDALAQYHPHRADLVDDAEKDQCAKFLSRYDAVFTTNYDLLLYWVLYPRLKDSFFDGFGGFGKIAWKNGEADQNVYYLHGALHLHRERTSTLKRIYGGKTPILDQLDQAIKDGETPLFVSEGTWEQKLSAIEDSRYLRYAYNSLRANKRALTLYGFGFHANDQHIVDAIARSKTPSLEVVLHSGASPKARSAVRERARTLRNRMRVVQGKRVGLTFSDSDDYNVWR